MHLHMASVAMAGRMQSHMLQELCREVNELRDASRRASSAGRREPLLSEFFYLSACCCARGSFSRGRSSEPRCPSARRSKAVVWRARTGEQDTTTTAQGNPSWNELSVSEKEEVISPRPSLLLLPRRGDAGPLTSRP